MADNRSETSGTSGTTGESEYTSNEDREMDNFTLYFNSLYVPIAIQARGIRSSGEPINIEHLRNEMIPSVRNRLEAIVELLIPDEFGPGLLAQLYSFMIDHPLIKEDLQFIENIEDTLRRDPGISINDIVSPDEQEGIEKIRLLISDLYKPILDKIRSAYTNLQPERPLEERRLLDMSHLYPRVGDGDGDEVGVGDGRNRRKHKARTHKKHSTRTNKKRSTRTNKKHKTRTHKKHKARTHKTRR